MTLIWNLVVCIGLSVLQPTICSNDITAEIVFGMDCDSSQHLCKNGATCVNIRPDISTKRFKCICINGFDGDYCEHNVDDCADNLCELGSKCIDGIAKYTCDCPLGKIGVFCQLDDPCVLEPCKAGSECVVDTASGTYQCECQKGYTGRHCSEDINECELGETLCLNGGTCVNTNGSWYCECPSEYKGRNCMQHVNLCEVNPCRNDGTCIDYGSHIMCICEPGFYGDLCEHKCVYGSRDAICIEYELNLKQIDSDVPQAIKQFCEDHKCETKIGNGVCDSECNHYECEFDGGDCSALTKPFSSCATPSFCARVFHDSKCDPACASEECLFDGFDCAARIERCPFEELCKAHYANGICDDICNTALCLYDGGDCEDREHSKNSKLPGHLMLILLIDPSEFLARASAFLFVLSRTLRASVQVAVENGDPMIFGWNLEGGLENLFKSSSANESETYMHQRSAMRGTLVVLTVDTSLCLADDCFTSLNDVAAYLGAAYANHVLQELKIPVYSARAEIPPNDNGMRNKILLLTIATMGTLIISLLAIQLIRKRKMVHVTKTWFPPLNDSYTSSNANLSECGIEKGVFDLEKGTISKRILPNIVPLTVPELFPREDNSVPLSPIRFSELPNETNRWTTQLHIEASSTAAISLPVNVSCVNVRDEVGRTPLMRTSVNLMKAECVTIDDIKYLLNAGALIDEQDDNEESALMLAVKAGRCAVVRYLLERGADSDLQDAKQRTALHHAVALSALPLVNILLTDRNTNVNTLDESNCTPLMICAKHELIGVEIAELLIHAGADVSVDGRKVKPNYNGRTALHFAAQLCNLDMIRFLIRSGANKDAQDVLNQTPLFLAASEGHVEAVELLLNEGASKEISDYKERSPKDVAVEKNFPEVVERLTAQTVINDKKLNGQNQMHFKKNYKKSKRPLVKKVRPTVHHRIAPLEFLTPPQSDTSTFFSPVHMINDLRQHFSSITAPVPPAIVSPPYEFTLNRSLYSAKKIPNYNERQQGVVRTSSSTTPNVFTDSLGSTLMEEVSSHLDDFNDHPSGYYV